MEDSKPPALVFGGGINGLGIVRNLGAEEVDVYLVVERSDQATYSKYCKKSFILPDFTRKPSAVKSFLSEFARLSFRARPVVFTTDDRTTLTLSSLKDSMAANYRFIVPSIRSSNTLIVKSNFYESLANSRIEHPKVIPAKTRSDLHGAGKELGYPIFVRPCMSQTFADIVGGKGFLARSEGELVNCFTIAADAGLEVILQELIPGPGTNNFDVVGYFNDFSRPLALFSYRRLRAWPTILGNSCLAESFPICSVRSVVDTLVKYLVDLRYQGLFEAEFKRDPRDGGYKLLEINARSSWQNSFPTKCGLNIIYKAYLDSIGLGGDYTEHYSAGVKWINLVEDMAASFAAKEILKTSWVRSFMGTKQHAFFDPDDPAPALITLLFDLGLIDTTRGRLRPAIVRRTLQSTKNLPIQ